MDFDPKHPGAFKRMTLAQRGIYRRYRRAQKNQKCDCGQPMFLMKWGEPVCKRCNTIENQQDHADLTRQAVDGREFRLCLPSHSGINGEKANEF